ncbi:MAG: hypothetical protein WCS89_02240 [Candidatus Paceibacterota bacterium]|jgi:hypothetical protein
MKTLNFRLQGKAELDQAIHDPENRQRTCEEHHCTEQELDQHPGWLIIRFAMTGGAARFAREHRNEFLEEKKVPEGSVLSHGG